MAATTKKNNKSSRADPDEEWLRYASMFPSLNPMVVRKAVEARSTDTSGKLKDEQAFIAHIKEAHAAAVTASNTKGVDGVNGLVPLPKADPVPAFWEQELASRFKSRDMKSGELDEVFFSFDLDPDDDAVSGADALVAAHGYWDHKHVTGLFCDPFISNTEIEGGHIELSHFIKTFELMMEVHVPGTSPFLTTTLFPDAEKQFYYPLRELIRNMHKAVYVNQPQPDFSRDVTHVRDGILALSPEDPLLWVPTVWPKHAIHWVFVYRDATSVDVIYCNSAGGVDSGDMFPKGRAYTRQCFPNVSLERVTSDAFLMAYVKMGMDYHDNFYKGNYCEKILFPLMYDLSTHPERVQPLRPCDMKHKPAFGALELMIPKTQQKAGTCYIKGTLATIHYVLGGYGMSLAQQKAVFALMRVVTITQITKELEGSRLQHADKYSLSVSQYKLLQIAEHQTVTAISKAVSGEKPTMPTTVLPELKKVLERFHSVMPKKIIDAVRVTQPRALAIKDTKGTLDQMKKDTVLDHDGYDLVYEAFGKGHDIGQFAGKVAPRGFKGINLSAALKPGGYTAPQALEALVQITSQLESFKNTTQGTVHPIWGAVSKTYIQRLVLEAIGVPPPLEAGGQQFSSHTASLNTFWQSMAKENEAFRQKALCTFWMVSKVHFKLCFVEPLQNHFSLCRRFLVQLSLFTAMDAMVRLGVGKLSQALKSRCMNPSFCGADFWKTMILDCVTLAKTRHDLMLYCKSMPAQTVMDQWMARSADAGVKYKDQEPTEMLLGQEMRTLWNITLKEDGQSKLGPWKPALVVCYAPSSPCVKLDGTQEPDKQYPDFLWPWYRDAALFVDAVLYWGTTQFDGCASKDFDGVADWKVQPSPSDVGCTWQSSKYFRPSSRSSAGEHGILGVYGLNATSEPEAKIVANSVTKVWFPECLTRRDSEALASFLGTSHLRISLLLEYLSTIADPRLSAKCEEAMMGILAECGPWVETVKELKGDDVPAETLDPSTPLGLLAEEWTHHVDTIVDALKVYAKRVEFEEGEAAPFDGPITVFLQGIRIISLVRRMGNALVPKAHATTLASLDTSLEKLLEFLEMRLAKAHETVQLPLVAPPAQQANELFGRLEQVEIILLHRALLISSVDSWSKTKTGLPQLSVIAAVMALTRLRIASDYMVGGMNFGQLIPALSGDQMQAAVELPKLSPAQLTATMNHLVGLVYGPKDKHELEVHKAEWKLGADGLVTNGEKWAICLYRGLVSSPHGDVPVILEDAITKHPTFEHAFGPGTKLIGTLKYQCDNVTCYTTSFKGLRMEMELWKPIKPEDYYKLAEFKADKSYARGYENGYVTLGDVEYSVYVGKDSASTRYPKPVSDFLETLWDGTQLYETPPPMPERTFYFFGLKSELNQSLPMYHFAGFVAPKGSANAGCYVELWVVNVFSNPVAHLYALQENGRRLYRKLIWTSNSDFALATLSPDMQPTADTFKVSLRSSAGHGNLDSFTSTLTSRTLVVRALPDHDLHSPVYQLLPPETVTGTMPEALLECEVDAALEPDPSLLLEPGSPTSPGSPSSPTSSLGGPSSSVSSERKLWVRLAAADVWSPGAKPPPKLSQVELFCVSIDTIRVRPDVNTSNTIHIAVAPSGMARIRYGPRQLLDSAFAHNEFVSGAVQALARLDSLSHILQWWADGSGTPEFELPRVQLRFGYDTVTTLQGSNEVRLMSKSHNRLFVSNQRGPRLWRVLYGLPHGLLMESEAGALSVIIPSAAVQRLSIAKAPLTVQCAVMRGSVASIPPGTPRTYLLPIHISCERLVPESVEVALYVMHLQLLHRNYAVAANLAPICHVDHPLTHSEQRVLRMFGSPDDDTHPDHFAVLLRLTLALGFCTALGADGVSEVPMNFPQGDPMKLIRQVSGVLRHVSVDCRLTLQEWEQLFDTRVPGTNSSQKVTKLIEDPFHEELSRWITQVCKPGTKSVTWKGTYSTRGPLDGAWLRNARLTLLNFDDDIKALDKAKEKLPTSDGYIFKNAFCMFAYRRQPITTRHHLNATIEALFHDNCMGQYKFSGFLLLYEIISGHIDLLYESGLEPKSQSRSMWGWYLLQAIEMRGKMSMMKYPWPENVLELARALLMLPDEAKAKLPKVPDVPEMSYDNNGCRVHRYQRRADEPDPKTRSKPYHLSPFVDWFLALFKVINDYSKELAVPIVRPKPFSKTESFKYQTECPFTYFRTEQSDTKCQSIDLRQVYLGDINTLYVHFPFGEARVMATTPLLVAINELVSNCGTVPAVASSSSSASSGSAVLAAGPLHPAAFTDNVHNPNSAEAKSVNRLMGCSRSLSAPVHKDPHKGEPSHADTIGNSLSWCKKAFAIHTKGDITRVRNALAHLRQVLLHQQIVDERGALSAKIWAKELATYPVVRDGSKPSDYHHATLYQLLLRTGQAPRVSLAELAQVNMSSGRHEDLSLGNPFLDSNFELVAHCTNIALLRYCRVMQTGQCLLQVADALRAMEEAETTNRFDEVNAAISALLNALFATRQYPKVHKEPTVEAKETCFGRVHGTIDPRYLCFEYTFGVTLWQRQLELSENLLAKEAGNKSSVVQLLMGMGKSSVVAPLMALPLTEKLLDRDEGGVLVVCVPRPLVRQATVVLGGRFTAMTDKTPLLFNMTRQERQIPMLRHKVETAARYGNVLISSPEALKCAALRCSELTAGADADLSAGESLEAVYVWKFFNPPYNCFHTVTYLSTNAFKLDGGEPPASHFILRSLGPRGWSIHPADRPKLALQAPTVLKGAVQFLTADIANELQVWQLEPHDEDKRKFGEEPQFLVSNTSAIEGTKTFLYFANHNMTLVDEKSKPTSFQFPVASATVVASSFSEDTVYQIESTVNGGSVVCAQRGYTPGCKLQFQQFIPADKKPTSQDIVANPALCQFVARRQSPTAFSLHLRCDQNLVMTAPSSTGGGDATVAPFVKGNSKQLWSTKLLPFDAVAITLHDDPAWLLSESVDGANAVLDQAAGEAQAHQVFMLRSVDKKGREISRRFLYEVRTAPPKQQQQSSQPKEKRFVPCKNCLENGADDHATVYCDECKASLCNKCSTSIHSISMFKHHHVDQVGEKEILQETGGGGGGEGVCSVPPLFNEGSKGQTCDKCKGALVLTKGQYKTGWICNGCQKHGPTEEGTYFCAKCQHDFCSTCFASIQLCPCVESPGWYVVRATGFGGKFTKTCLTAGGASEKVEFKEYKEGGDATQRWQMWSVGSTADEFVFVPQSLNPDLTAAKDAPNCLTIQGDALGISTFKKGNEGTQLFIVRIVGEAVMTDSTRPLQEGARVALRSHSDAVATFSTVVPYEVMQSGSYFIPKKTSRRSELPSGFSIDDVTYESDGTMTVTWRSGTKFFVVDKDPGKKLNCLWGVSSLSHTPTKCKITPVPKEPGYYTISHITHGEEEVFWRGYNGSITLNPDPEGKLRTSNSYHFYFQQLHGSGVVDAAKMAPLSYRFERSSGKADAEHLRVILQHFRKGIILVDEVDSVMAPMTAELNFPIGPEDLVPLGQSRWRFAIEALKRCIPLLQAGVAAKKVQTSPHLVLVDPDWYATDFRSSLVDPIVTLLSEKFSSCVPDRNVVIEFFKTPDGIMPGPLAVLKDFEQQLLCLARQWLYHLFPHCVAKVSRVSFGLSSDPTRLVAVPFLAKDVPSDRSEFAHPDIVIGLGFLAYLYEGLRLSDVESMLKHLIHDFGVETGPDRGRPTYCLFESFLPPTKEGDARLVPPINMINLAKPGTLELVHSHIRFNGAAIFFYLDTMVYPRALKFANKKLSACGQELGNKIMFETCLGFTGTSDDLLPSAIEPQHAIPDITQMLRILSDPVVSSAVELPERWEADTIMEIVARNKFDAAIDAGGLITKYPNEVVASMLLNMKGSNGKDYHLSHKDALVFLDAQTDRPLFITREQKQPRPLAECTVPLHRRFVFFDQVHCTGVDVLQAVDAKAAVLLGKDMTFRDLAQAAWRMRKLGPSGQHLVLHIPPELHILAKRDVAKLAPTKEWENSLLNIVLTHCVKYGAFKVGVNDSKLVDQEAGASGRRNGVEAMIRGEDSKHAFEEPVDHSVKLAPLAGSLDSEVVQQQQQQQEQQKEQQKVEQRIASEKDVATHRPWKLAEGLACADEDKKTFWSLHGVELLTKAAQGKVEFQALTGKDHILLTSNFLRVAGKDAVALDFNGTTPVSFLRGVYAILHWKKTGGKDMFSAVALAEADTLRALLRQATFPAGYTVNLWTRKGIRLAQRLAGAAPGAGAAVPIPKPLAVYRFLNGDLWYDKPEAQAIAEYFEAAKHGTEGKKKMRMLLFIISMMRRTESFNIDSSTLVTMEPSVILHSDETGDDVTSPKKK